MFGVALSICGFSFGVHSVRAPSWLHFRHAHAIIGIITFILTFFQLIVGLFVSLEDLSIVDQRTNDYPLLFVEWVHSFFQNQERLKKELTEQATRLIMNPTIIQDGLLKMDGVSFIFFSVL